MNGYLAAGGLIAGVLLLDRKAGTHVLTPHASSAGNAAAAAMRGRELIGVAFEVPESRDPIAIFVSMRRALIAKFGAQKLPGKQQYPDLPFGRDGELAVIDVWLDAYKAGRDSSPVDFNLSTSDNLVQIVQANTLIYALAENGRDVNEDMLSALGRAVVALLKWRRNVDDADKFFDAERIQETFDRALRLAAEMQHVSFTVDGVRPSEQGLTTDDVMRAIGNAPGVLAGWVGSAGGAVLGPVAAELLRSPVLWAIALGLVAWKVAT